eukprot:6811625-Alexandrium_andersonii.AAC.1
MSSGIPGGRGAASGAPERGHARVQLLGLVDGLGTNVLRYAEGVQRTFPPRGRTRHAGGEHR